MCTGPEPPPLGFEARGGHDKAVWESVRAEARERANAGLVSATARFFGSDTDKRVLDMARANARRAGVDKLISFQQKDATKLENPLPDGPKGTIISNPPYGERLESEPALIALHSVFGRVVKTRFRAGVCHYSVLPELLSSLQLRAEREFKAKRSAGLCAEKLSVK